MKAREVIKQSKSLINQGFMITRTGNDFTSESLRQFSEHDKTYSHCGIASIDHDSIFVYHAIGGEWNPDQKLRRDPIEIFCSPEDNRGFGIFKFDFTANQISNLDSVVRSWHHRGVTFDMEFSLKSDEKLYCAEFVAKAISTATSKRITFDTTKIKDFNFFAVDNLTLSNHCSVVSQYRF